MMTPPRPIWCRRALLAALCSTGLASAQSWLPSSPYPAWAATSPTTTLTISFDPGMSTVDNGVRLHTAIGALLPGQALAIGPGIWSIPNRLDLAGIGTAQSPFWLVAADPTQKPVITRPDASQNAMNMGSNGPARYWVLRDLEITGGSDLLRLYDCAQIWVDHCYLHDGLGIGIAAQTVATDHLYLTNNEIARPGPGTNGEALYLGANNGALAVSWSVVAYNHVHDTRAAVLGQGDGIELKQGSHHNWLLGNRVHDCRNPCILVYGTGGNAENVVEGNLCYDSDDVVLQVQGEAIVRNNLALGGSIAFGSHDHQGPSRELQVVHNTFVSQGPGASMQAWSGRPGMVFANNVVYSLGGESMHFGNGSMGVQVAGNVAFGPTYNLGSGYVVGTGLQDFVDVSLATWHTDATPVLGGAIDNRGNPNFLVARDTQGTLRQLPLDPGAITNDPTLHSPSSQISLSTGGSQQLRFEAPRLAGAGYHVLGSISDTTPGLSLGAFVLPLGFDFWLLATLQNPNSALLQNTQGSLDAIGRTTATVTLPPLPAALHGLVVHHALVALQGPSVTFVSNAVALTLQ